MSKNLNFYYILTLLFLLQYTLCYSQDNFKEQLEFRHDNDIFLFTDEYYSAGLFLTYRRALDKGIIKGKKEQLAISINHETYTPSRTQTLDSDLFDRTYAGFAGLKISWSFSTQNQFYNTAVLAGIAGPNSGARELQQTLHNLLGLSEVFWINQINNSFHLNTYFKYVREWKIAPNPFSIRAAFIPNIALGSRDIYIEPETVFYFGKRSNIDKSSAYNRIGAIDKEIYFALRTSYRNVLHNGLIEGNLFGDNSLVLRESTNSIWRFGLDLNYRFRRSDYKISFIYNTNETETSVNHRYGIISYGISF